MDKSAEISLAVFESIPFSLIIHGVIFNFSLLLRIYCVCEKLVLWKVALWGLSSPFVSFVFVLAAIVFACIRKCPRMFLLFSCLQLVSLMLVFKCDVLLCIYAKIYRRETTVKLFFYSRYSHKWRTHTEFRRTRRQIFIVASQPCDAR